MQDQRDTGRHQVFDAIRASGRIARIDIARQTAISPATVTAITSELLDAGLIEECHPDAAPQGLKRGRPRVALAVRAEAFVIAGMKVADRQISVVLMDFVGETIGEYTHPISEGRMAPEMLARLIGKVLAAACAENGRDLTDVAGLGLGLAGLVDARRNFVYWSPNLNARNVPFGAVLREAMDIPIFLENDANLVAKAEQRFGEGRGEDNFVVVTIEQGVGMGIVIDSKIYRGERGCGAELGHTKVQLDGAMCRCGQRGCLEAYIGDYALLREAATHGEGLPHDDLVALYDCARAGDATARRIFERAGRMLALGLVNVINIFDPRLVILAGAQLSLDFLDSEAVLQQVKDGVVQVDAPLPEIRFHKWGDLMWAMGAAAYAMDSVSALKLRALSRDAA